MKTLFSHIVQKRLSHESEDVATEALTFILRSSEAARRGFLKLLRTIEPELPDLHFRAQQSEDLVRPDMWGLDDQNTPHVFVENKFWAGLTENQPVEYLGRLARHSQPSVLLVVAPEARQETLWGEFGRRLRAAKVGTIERDSPPSVSRVAETDIGPTLSLTSWRQLLAAIEAQLADEPRRQHDLFQLRALCEAADVKAFIPLAPEELTNQRLPALVLQMNAVVEDVVARGLVTGILSTDGLTAASRWTRIGRYVSFPEAKGVGAWIGTHFRLWRDHGRTPLWLVFSPTKWGRAPEVRALLEPWANREGVPATRDGDNFVVGIELVTGEEKDRVAAAVIQRLSDIAQELTALADKER